MFQYSRRNFIFKSPFPSAQKCDTILLKPYQGLNAPAGAKRFFGKNSTALRQSYRFPQNEEHGRLAIRPVILRRKE